MPMGPSRPRQPKSPAQQPCGRPVPTCDQLLPAAPERRGQVTQNRTNLRRSRSVVRCRVPARQHRPRGRFGYRLTGTTPRTPVRAAPPGQTRARPAGTTTGRTHPRPARPAPRAPQRQGRRTRPEPDRAERPAGRPRHRARVSRGPVRVPRWPVRSGPVRSASGRNSAR